MYLGIDLGTSNSAVVGYVNGRTQLYKAADGSDVVPSVIYLDRRGHRFIGKAAQDRLLAAPKNVASGFKRLMGTKSLISIANENWSPEQCSSEIVKTLVSQSMTESGNQDIDGTVITIPAAFNQMQNEATISAARMAGLERVSLLQEPVAAAMASIANSDLSDGVFLVYDLGGGTFDVALVLSTQGAVNVIAHEGINMLGGRDFDRIIFDSLVRPWLLENFDLPTAFQGEDKYKHLSSIAKFTIERAKIELSASTTSSIFASEDELRTTDESGEEVYISLDISRDEIEDLIRGRIEETISLCRKMIVKNGYTHEDISRIVPIGGPSKMPIVRQMLQNELAIEVEQGLDPMTAVAMGAALFAESREWQAEGSIRKSTRVTDAIRGAFNLKIDYKTRVSSDHARIRLKPESDVPAGTDIEIFDEEGGTSGKKPLDGPVALSLTLRKKGDNRFRIQVTDATGKNVADVSRDIVITRTAASAAAIPMTYTLAVKTLEGMVGAERNSLHPILKKGTSLPAEGHEKFRSAKTLKGGEDDSISFQFYDMAEGVADPERNLHIGDFHLNAAEELEFGERLNRGEEIIIHWKVSDNALLSFSVEIPSLGKIIDANNLYLAKAGHKDYEGSQGSEIASEMLGQAEKDLAELDEILEGEADGSGKIRARIEQQHLSLSSSTEADTNRSVADEAMRLRQEIALLRLSPENEAKVLDADIRSMELGFDSVRSLASETDCRRHEQLLGTARRLVREHDYEKARSAVEEMRAIGMRAMFENPHVHVHFFEMLAADGQSFIDEQLFRRHVAEGNQAIEEGDIERLRLIIGRMFDNKIPSSGDPAEIVELAHLLKN
jgi:molecular chaperone DnaK